MVAKDPASWQFRYVGQYGSTTARVDGLLHEAPLRVERGNFPIGSDVGVDAYPLVVTGEYLKISYALPEDVEGTFTGRIRVYRKSKEFSRDIDDVSSPAVDSDPAELVLEEDHSALLGGVDRLVYDDRFRVLDQSINAGTLWYYTIFFEMGPSSWAFDPANSHSRNWAYKQSINDSGAAYSPMGEYMYARLSRAVRIKDAKEADLATYRFYQILGRMLDQVKEEIEVLKTRRFDTEVMDFQELTYTDWLLGWPTNFELSESARRRETEQAVSLWKAKGTVDSLELALQTITGWDVQIYEGWKWVLNTYDGQEELDPLAPPPDWNAATDGDWANLVASVPALTTTFDTSPEHGVNIGLPGDQNAYTPSNEVLNDGGGVGWWWQNPNGILILLTPVTGAEYALTEVIVAKVSRIAPMFALHYAAFSIAVRIVSQEEWKPLGEDALVSFSIDGLDTEDYAFLSDADVTDTVTLCELYTWPHPTYPLGSRLGNELYTAYNSWLTYACDLVEEEDMPQHVHLTSDQVASNTIPYISVGNHKFDPTSYAGSRVFYFGVVGFISGVTLAKSATVVLWDSDNGEAVATLAFNNTNPDRTISGLLTVGSAVGNLKDTLTNYEVRVTLNGAADPSDVASIGNAFILVE